MQIPSAPFGNTGLVLPRIGLGLAALGRPGYINLGHGQELEHNYDLVAMEQRTHAMLDLAYANGVRYFDTARSYGKAEDFLKSWLSNHQFDAKQLSAGSKWGYTYTADWKVEADQHEVKEHSLEVLNRQWSLSKKLQPYLQLYQIHSATFESGVLENTAVLNRLATLKSEGILIGLSLSGPQQGAVLHAAASIQIDGAYLFDAVQITYNILEQGPAPAIQAAADRGMGVIIKEALANGRLTNKNNAPDFQAKKQLLDQLAQKHEVGIDALAMAFILAQPWAHLVLSGAVLKEHLLSNLKAGEVVLEEEDLTSLTSLAMTSESYWMERKGLGWN